MAPHSVLGESGEEARSSWRRLLERHVLKWFGRVLVKVVVSHGVEIAAEALIEQEIKIAQRIGVCKCSIMARQGTVLAVLHHLEHNGGAINTEGLGRIAVAVLRGHG